MKVLKTLSENYDLRGLKGKLLLVDPDTVPLTPPELYIRSDIDRDWVVRLQALIEEGAELDPIVVAFVKDIGKEVLVGGNHRVEAYSGIADEIKVLHIGEISLEEFFKLQRELNPDILPMDTEDLKRYAEKLYDRLKEKYEGKELYEKIAEIVGRNTETVRKWLSRKVQEEKQAKIRKAIELREKGLSIREIAEQLGEPKTTVERWLSHSGKEHQNGTLSLFTPTSEPTPEGIRLFGDWILEIEKFEGVKDLEGFRAYLESKGYEVKPNDVDIFLTNLKHSVKIYINNLVKSGLKTKQIQEAMTYEREGIFSHLSTVQKKKLALLLQDYTEKKVEERRKRSELEAKVLETAKEIIKDPTYTYSNWLDLAVKVREKLGDEHPVRGSADTREIADILALHADYLLKLYREIPEPDDEIIKETISELDLEEDLTNLKEELKYRLIERGYRYTTGAELLLVMSYNEYHSTSPAPSPSPLAGPQPAFSEEDERERLRRELEESWERAYAQRELQPQKNEKYSAHRPGRPREIPEEGELDPEWNYRIWREEIELRVHWIREKYGIERAIQTLEEVLEVIRNLPVR